MFILGRFGHLSEIKIMSRDALELTAELIRDEVNELGGKWYFWEIEKTRNVDRVEYDNDFDIQLAAVYFTDGSIKTVPLAGFFIDMDVHATARHVELCERFERRFGVLWQKVLAPAEVVIVELGKHRKVEIVRAK